MNANNIIKEGMTLDEKLKAIEMATQAALDTNARARDDAHRRGVTPPPPIDPSDLTRCDGCE